VAKELAAGLAEEVTAKQQWEMDQATKGRSNESEVKKTGRRPERMRGRSGNKGERGRNGQRGRSSNNGQRAGSRRGATDASNRRRDGRRVGVGGAPGGGVGSSDDEDSEDDRRRGGHGGGGRRRGANDTSSEETGGEEDALPGAADDAGAEPDKGRQRPEPQQAGGNERNAPFDADELAQMKLPSRNSPLWSNENAERVAEEVDTGLGCEDPFRICLEDGWKKLLT
jgi:curved DNA-binding protein CbpA